MKSTNLKRFGAAALSGAMALSMAAPAFAADPNTVTINGEYKAITLNVTVPTSAGSALINPYGLPVDLTHEETPTGGGDPETVKDATISGQQITTAAPLMISNQSGVALAVSAEVSGTVAGNTKLIEDATKVNVAEAEGTDQGKVLNNVAAKFEAFAAPTFEGNPDDWADEDKNLAFAALKSEDAVLTAPVLTDATTTTGSLVLREGDDEDLPQAGSAAFIRLSGSVAKKPETPWATTDKFVTTIAFTFEPAEYVGTVALAGNDSVAVGSTAKLTVSGLPETVKVKYDTIKVTSSKETYVTAVNSTKAPTAPDTNVEASAVTLTVTGVKTSSTKSVITVEFEGTDGILYRGTMEVKCA